ncbi:AfsR/SARP family transcriptional regulator [Streptomyces scabiei]|uniref:AfsR/SARP family transcriptional regulator n=1 Tax=Streptomyces scabiei TaxID=1930 RepID=UPI0029B27A54|nr:BTAD domain-containing putative transcriptional regulator [Streptomyces scabiei]MDX3115587.1 BTAD domain-containing putative transcriptional regulator [Streptomyces scabiei]
MGPPQRRSVMAALAVDAGRAVPIETLMRRVWGEDRPEGARQALYAHVARIRRVLAATGAVRPQVLLRRNGGYVLDVDAEDVDLHRFHRLVADARRAGRGDAEQVTTLREALDLWRGEPLAGLSGEWVSRMRDTWQRQRLDAVTAWANAETAVGNHAVVIDRVPELIDQHPLVEPLVAVLMRALYEAGRGSEALECFAETRKRLADELGADPGTELRRLHRVILRGDPEPAEVTDPPPPARPRSAPLLARLPLDVPAFTGREEELAQLDKILAEGMGSPAVAVVSTLSGTAGVGKTAVAVHWAHRAADWFEDGQLYVNLHGFEPSRPPVTPAEALPRLLETLGVLPQHMPVSPEAQAGLYRSMLAGRRMLVMLDNARDAEQVRAFLPGSPGCFTLVTSRNRLSGLIALEGARSLVLDVLPAAECRRLLARRTGAERVMSEPLAVDEIVTRCARLPLALVIVAARAAIEPELGLARLATELRDAQDSPDGLDSFGNEDTRADIRAVFSWSYGTLSPQAARMFRLLGVHPGPDISVPAAASLAGLPVRHAGRLLTALADSCLVTEHSRGRYVLHDLLRMYAAELAGAADAAGETQAAEDRLFGHYLHSAHAADRMLDPHRDPIALPPPVPGVSPEHAADHGEALAWFTAEHPVLLAVAHRPGITTQAPEAPTWQLTRALTTFLQRRGHWSDWAAAQQTALDAALRSASPAGEAEARSGLGRACTRLMRLDDALAHLARARDLHRALGNRTELAHTHLDLARLHARRDSCPEALACAQEALDQYTSLGHRTGRARALNSVGWYHAQLGDHRQCLVFCGQALELFAELGVRDGQADTWDSLGYAHQHLGDHRRAAACYRNAVALFHGLGDRYYEADVLAHLCESHRAAGEADAARRAARRAADILDELGVPDSDAVRARLRRLGLPAGP